MKKEYTYLGDIHLSEKTDITDSCYNKDVWCRTTVNARPGVYKCFATNDDESRSIAEIAVLHDSYRKNFLTNNKDLWTYIEDIGVDSGLAGFFQNKKDYSNAEWKEFCARVDEEEKSEHILLPDAHVWNEIGGGNCFFSTSGYGDGGYPVYGIKNADGSYVALKIVFI